MIATVTGTAYTDANLTFRARGRAGAFIQGTGMISQVISGFKPGLMYTVIFSAAERGAGATWNIAGQTWHVTLDGASLARYAPPKSATGYTDYTATFTATTAFHTIGFVGTNANGGDNTVLLDDYGSSWACHPPDGCGRRNHSLFPVGCSDSWRCFAPIPSPISHPRSPAPSTEMFAWPPTAIPAEIPNRPYALCR